MRSSTKTLSFPLGGVSRRGGYRKQTRPYSAPWAVNVRAVGPSESRRRGGSRPGLSKLCPTDLGADVTALIPVTYIDSGDNRRHDLVYVVDGALGYVRSGVAYDTTAELEDSNGVDVLDDNGVTIDFSSTVSTGALQGAVRAGKIYLADTTLKTYDPGTGVVEAVPATGGTVPTGQPVISVYRDRIFLGGSDNLWYASRLGDSGDWDFGDDWEDPGRAVAGQLSDAAGTGGVVTAFVPVHDQHLVMATENTLWVLRGDPATGRLENVSSELGIVSSGAWAVSPDGLLVFLSNDGIYVWSAASSASPARLSEEQVPDELREVSTSTNTVSMAYDPVERGFHLFVTPSSGVGTHWWIDPENKAVWPQVFHEDHQPLSSALLTTTGLGDVVIGGQDGYIRKFDQDEHEDDGLELASHVLIGPVRLSADDVRDGLLAEINGVMEDFSTGGSVTWRVVLGKSAAEAVEAAVDDLDNVLDGLDPSSAFPSGSWSEGRDTVQRPRARGAWLVVWLSSTASWSYEMVAIVARQLGRHR